MPFITNRNQDIYQTANETLYSATARRRSSVVAGLDIDQVRHFKLRRRSSVFGTTEDWLASLRLPRRQSLTSPFLALPAEIGNQIYTSLFEIEGTPRIRPGYTLPSLLKTCRKIYTEAIGLYSTTTPFRCLDEDSAVSWLSTLPQKYLDMVSEVRYDGRWIILVTPYIPVPGAECWLFQNLVRRLEARGQCDLEMLLAGECTEERKMGGNSDRQEGRSTGRMRVSYYRKGESGNVICWTDKPGSIEVAIR